MKAVSALSFANERKAFLVNLCSGKTVLHLGCSASPDTLGRLQRTEHVHALLIPYVKEIYGIDRDEDGLIILRSLGYENLFVGDVEQLEKSTIAKRFDVILIPEIIEHLANPLFMLNGIKRFMKEDSLVCITTPNALSLKFFLHALCYKEVSGPDHLMIFSPHTLQRLLERAGFEILEILGALEAHHGIYNRLTRSLFRFVFKIMPQFSDVIIVIAKVKEYAQCNHADVQ
jgi:2-polyprenyl-3-methyl-5-hydroxy-6-metoxy-1,4-benzoquinol methylase